MYLSDLSSSRLYFSHKKSVAFQLRKDGGRRRDFRAAASQRTRERKTTAPDGDTGSPAILASGDKLRWLAR